MNAFEKLMSYCEDQLCPAAYAVVLAFSVLFAIGLVLAVVIVPGMLVVGYCGKIAGGAVMMLTALTLAKLIQY